MYKRQAKTSAVAVAMFACIAGSIKLQGSVTAVTTIPSVILTFLVISIVATRFGQKKAMVIGSIGGIICNVIPVSYTHLKRRRRSRPARHPRGAG